MIAANVSATTIAYQTSPTRIGHLMDTLGWLTPAPPTIATDDPEALGAGFRSERAN